MDKKLDTIAGVMGALDVSLRWMREGFSEFKDGHEERSVEAIMNALASAMLACSNLEGRLKRDAGTTLQPAFDLEESTPTG